MKNDPKLIFLQIFENFRKKCLFAKKGMPKSSAQVALVKSIVSGDMLLARQVGQSNHIIVSSLSLWIILEPCLTIFEFISIFFNDFGFSDIYEPSAVFL